MSRSIHPSELAQLLRNQFVAKSLSITILVLSLLLLAAGSRANYAESRLWFFGSSLVCAVLSRQMHTIAIDNERLFDDSRDISLTNWQNQLFKRTRDEGLSIEAQIQKQEIDPLPLFDWSELADSDQHPVLVVIAPMGGGKSRLVKWLGKYVLFERQPSIIAFDIYARDQDWEGAVTEYGKMLEVMKADLNEISDRKQRYRLGHSDFSPQLRVLEEAVDTLPNIKALSKEAEETVDSWLRVHVSVARKLKQRLCLVSVKLRSADIGIGSESRDDATIIFVGQKGVQKAMNDVRYLKLGAKPNTDLKESLRMSLESVKHPALIYSSGEWFPASVPSLSATGDLIGGNTDSSEEQHKENHIDQDVESLEKIYALSSRFESITPGKVRKFIPSLKASSDADILSLFELLEEDEKGQIEKSGKAPKFRAFPDQSTTKKSA